MAKAMAIRSGMRGIVTTNEVAVVAGTFGQSSFTSAEAKESDPQTVSRWASSLSRPTRSKLEAACLQLAKEYLGMGCLVVIRADAQLVCLSPFHGRERYIAVVAKGDSGYRLLVKGDPETLLGYCDKKAGV
ncbi:hypothetical protein DL769_003399 [Monosporascus sp. CRB-8-3]|nr:hypothetical protein DL769_003399 [Monosporascus sp. CRB-8-3]